MSDWTRNKAEELSIGSKMRLELGARPKKKMLSTGSTQEDEEEWSLPEEENVVDRIDRHKTMKKNVDRIDGCQEKKTATSSAKKHVNECKAKKNFPACQEGLLRVSPSSNNSSP